VSGAHHLITTRVDERHLVFLCKYCGAMTDPLTIGEPVPDDFPGVLHDLKCPIVQLYTKPEAA